MGILKTFAKTIGSVVAIGGGTYLGLRILGSTSKAISLAFDELDETIDSHRKNKKDRS